MTIASVLHSQAEGMFCVFYGDSYLWYFTVIVVIDYDDCLAMRLDCILGFLYRVQTYTQKVASLVASAHLLLQNTARALRLDILRLQQNHLHNVEG